MNVDDVLRKLKPWRDKHAQQAWQPVTVDEDGLPTTSKFSGRVDRPGLVRVRTDCARRST